MLSYITADYMNVYVSVLSTVAVWGRCIVQYHICYIPVSLTDSWHTTSSKQNNLTYILAVSKLASATRMRLYAFTNLRLYHFRSKVEWKIIYPQICLNIIVSIFINSLRHFSLLKKKPISVLYCVNIYLTNYNSYKI